MEILTNENQFYQGKLLLATPNMTDFRFEKSVVFLCSHTSEGAMGIIINKPVIDITFEEILKKMNLAVTHKSQYPDIYFGGPVEIARGFVLHSNDYNVPDVSLEIQKEFRLTSSIEIMKDIVNGEGPKQSLFALGYAGWAAGQLEHEITLDSWLICNADNNLLFSMDATKKWSSALTKMGISPSHLAGVSGSA